MKFYNFLILLLILGSSVFGQNRHNTLISKRVIIQTEGTTKNSKDDIQKLQRNNSFSVLNSPAKKRFAFIATVVYPSGEIIPVANSTFYILDTEFLTILKNADIQPTDATLQFFEGNTDKALISDAGYSLSGKYPTPYRELAEKVTDAIKPYIVQQITTDSSGRGVFKQLNQSNYYLLGTGGAKFSNVIWNMQIDTAKDSNLVLDQRNAAKVR